MPYYKSPDNKVHYLDDEKFKHLLPVGSVQITEEEAEELNAPPPETAEQIIARLEAALDRHLDAVANSYRYESIRTMVTYATSEHQTFGPEGRAAVKFRDAVYAYGIQVIADVEAGNRDIPTEEELIAELPLITAYFE
jgi:hypothetical protein